MAASCARYAAGLAEAGVRRINVSLDTLDADALRATSPGAAGSPTCWTASTRPPTAGLEIKINMVAMRGVNDDEIEPMMALGAWPRLSG